MRAQRDSLLSVGPTRNISRNLKVRRIIQSAAATATLKADLQFLVPLLVVCTVLVVLVTGPRAPKNEVSRFSFPGSTSAGDVAQHEFFFNLTDSPKHKPTMWLWLNGTHHASPNDPAPLLDGFIFVYVFNKTCPYGRCTEIARYDISLSIEKRCGDCMYSLVSGPMEHPLRRIRPVAGLVPSPGKLATHDLQISSDRISGSIVLTVLPEPEKFSYGQSALLLDFGIHVNFDGLQVFLTK
eukprot:c8219_g1_i1.p1 GENE.c8219_g1_i1~~c8219_g1_i1.p1  ORF type:complete len:239 (-),score=40.88 c8219_g1_i1:201-917(-)